MTLTQSKRNLDTMLEKMSGAIHQSMQQGVQAMLAGRSLSADRQKMLDGMEAKMMAIMSEELRWDALEPLLVEVYRRSFTQQELDGMLTFYRTPAGQAVVAKLPLVMQNSFALMQERMKLVLPKITEMQKATLAQLSAQDKKDH